ncbi:mechanosensitive ion channel [Oscillatoria amoena NRMC-F 0135]|nr:mechanosensitive ion channel domain-containing protein [Oscillatoria laete-virens]MDL5046589.1 mechanosensitive ion channel [Oscillatoria amoena NRMC-F 0135]MDL5053579.1 mechanosensitive ion channel [Oscillatoria laete-virens NRMC-F 0139]
MFYSLSIPHYEQVAQELENQLLIFAPKIVAGLFILIVILVTAKIVDGLFHRFMRRIDSRRSHVFNLIRQTTKALILIIGGVTILATLGVNVSALIASLGLTGFALGFALRDALSNLLAGALILLYRPFGLSDRIMVSGFEGTVANIDLRYTTLTVDGKTFLIPNSVLFTNPITIVDRAHLKS